MDFIEFSQGCMAGDMSVLQYANQFKDRIDILRWSGLNHAINGHRSELAMQLIHRGYPINNVDIHGRTTLMNACMHGMVHVVAYILNQGVDISVSDNKGYDALYHSLSNHNNIVANMLLNRDAFQLSHCKVAIFEIACKDGNTEVLSRLTYHPEMKASLTKWIDLILFFDNVDALKPFIFHVVLGSKKTYKPNISTFLQQQNLLSSDRTINGDTILKGTLRSEDFLFLCANHGYLDIIKALIKKKKSAKLIRTK